MLGATLDELHARAEAFVEAIARAKIVESTAYAGGGSVAQAAIPSVAVAVAVANPDRCAARLREHAPPIVGRIDDGRILFDLRTIAPNEDAVVIRALAALSASE